MNEGDEVCPHFRVGGPSKGCDWAGRFQQRRILVIADKRIRIQQITAIIISVHFSEQEGTSAKMYFEPNKRTV